MALNLVGTDWDTINANLTTSYVEVTYVRAIKDFLVQARGDSNVRHKRRSADTNYFTIKAGGYADKKTILSDANFAGSSLGFFAVESGTDVLEGYVTF